MANLVATILVVAMFPDPGAGIVPPKPDINSMCLHVTSYWPYDENGIIYDGWHYQCNESCRMTGGLYVLPDLASQYNGGFAACITGWTARYGWPTSWIEIDQGYANGTGWYTNVACVDGFGAESYRQPFYHWNYQQWVIPIDILSKQPIHELVCNWDRYYDYAQDYRASAN
jgi:hypothetical protein